MIIVCYDIETTQDMKCVIVSFVILNMRYERWTVNEFKDREREGVYWTYEMSEFVDLMLYMLRTINKLEIHLFAHNAFKFDHWWFVDAVSDVNTECDLQLISMNDEVDDEGTRQMMGKIVNNKTESKIILKDTFKFLVTSLKDIGKQVKCPKLDVAITLCTEETKAEFVTYCCRDTKILWEAMKYIRDLLGVELEDRKICARHRWYRFASQADIAYTCSFKSFKCKMYQFSRLVYEEIKRAYYGARVDSSIYGMLIEGPIQCIDIRSMYPASLNRPIPRGQVKILKSGLDKEMFKRMPTSRDHPIIAYVRISKTAKDCYDKFFGVVPYRLNEGTNASQIMYVSEGRIEGWYADVAIYAFLLDGWELEEVYFGFEFEGWTADLTLFYQHCYNVRKKFDKSQPRNQSAKLLMNSSYGKYAQKLPKYKHYKFDDWEYEYNERSGQCIHVALYCLAWCVVQLVAMKTACNGYTIFYQDTDSAYFRAEDVAKIKVLHPEIFANDLSTGTGVFVDAEEIRQNIIVLGKKFYCVGNDPNNTLVHAKGHNKSQLSYYDFEAVLDGEYVSTDRLSMKGQYWAYMEPKAQERHRVFINCGKFETLERKINVVVPDQRYKCTECGMWHATRIENW